MTLSVCALFNAAKAQQTPAQFNVPVNYLVYLPQGYDKDTTKQWPVIVFLHGSGERGNDIQKVKKMVCPG